MSDGTLVRVIAFPGAPNLPTFAAMELGFFADHGVEVSLELTPSSTVQAERCARGEFDIACTAFDNVVAYAEGAGAAGPDVDPQYVTLMGATQLELSLIAAPDVEQYTDLVGRSIALDAPNTGFAFVLYEMLRLAGVASGSYEVVAVGATPRRWESVRDGQHAATLTLEPFTTIAQRAGFPVLGRSTDVLASYQGGVITAPRPSLEERPEAIQGFMQGYLDGLEWALDPDNRSAAGAMLVERLGVASQAVPGILDSLLSARSGLTPHGAILDDGVATVLELRSRYGGTRLEDPARYLDRSHYEAVIASR
jgi:ABC-type nitrate/sulfonate/bicarbonate transport system substrate-binding protein